MLTGSAKYFLFVFFVFVSPFYSFSFVWKNGQLDTAIMWFEKLVVVQRHQFGHDHRVVGVALHNVALVHLHAKKFEEASRACLDAIQVRRKALGNFHLDLAVSVDTVNNCV